MSKEFKGQLLLMVSGRTFPLASSMEQVENQLHEYIEGLPNGVTFNPNQVVIYPVLGGAYTHAKGGFKVGVTYSEPELGELTTQSEEGETYLIESHDKEFDYLEDLQEYLMQLLKDEEESPESIANLTITKSEVTRVMFEDAEPGRVTEIAITDLCDPLEAFFESGLDFDFDADAHGITATFIVKPSEAEPVEPPIHVYDIPDDELRKRITSASLELNKLIDEQVRRRNGEPETYPTKRSVIDIDTKNVFAVEQPTRDKF